MGEAMAPPAPVQLVQERAEQRPASHDEEPMFTSYQSQDGARGVGRPLNMNHSRAVSRVFTASHSHAVGWAMSSYHSRG